MKKILVPALVFVLGLAFAWGAVSSSVLVPITELNSAQDDFELTFSADGKTAVFASGREGGYGRHDIYISQFVGGKWQTPENIGPAINTADNDQEPTLSADGQALYFVRYNGLVSTPAGDYSDDDLFVSRKVGGVWQTAINWNDAPDLPPVNSLTSEEHCPIIVSKNLIYYSHSEPGVTQGSDIYQVSRVNGVWGKPEPLPGNINSPYRDHIHWTGLSKDGKSLIIVSNRPDLGSQGGIDEWISYKDKAGNWSVPENLGPVINTAGHEICWTFTPDGKYFVGSSDKPGGQGGDDFYSIERSAVPLLKNFKPNAKPPINLLR
jgi:Tol biopolymer transport system component